METEVEWLKTRVIAPLVMVWVLARDTENELIKKNIKQ